jgi:hypothetical protein
VFSKYVYSEWEIEDKPMDKFDLKYLRCNVRVKYEQVVGTGNGKICWYL